VRPTLPALPFASRRRRESLSVRGVMPMLPMRRSMSRTCLERRWVGSFILSMALRARSVV